MSLSTCEKCGGFIPLGPDATNCCEKCGAGVFSGSHNKHPALIDAMVDRFLGWKLPDDFNPDCGIIFKRTYNDHRLSPTRYEPVGTNLLSATQAKQMIEYLLKDTVLAPKVETGWLIETSGPLHPHMYRTLEQGMPVWTNDSQKALRFARQVDAESFAEDDPEDIRITEHMWG